jgi:hypothetical protein
MYESRSCTDYGLFFRLDQIVGIVHYQHIIAPDRLMQSIGERNAQQTNFRRVRSFDG